ncbi:unnamed protein product [Pneumocystis jirovecii]|uniref:mannose-1-phosphate guanylyltransferase n=1 Tax=Pneumocystis jirovecii TaxID=42068 RepID=L0P6Q8_PNEJI|nr:unnamed protein product [Pneumocystis jirovecii]
MKALILVGVWKSTNNPSVFFFCIHIALIGTVHQIEALAAAGVTDIVLAVNYCSEIMVSTLKQYEQQYHISITFSVENEPLGTAGPLALARNILEKDNSPFFVLNSDVICEYNFTQFLCFHQSHKSEGTIAVTKVEEPSKYGVIVMKPSSSEIERFVEKPVEFVSNKINAGLYVFNTSILERISLRPTSIEKEIFPAMASEGQLHSYDLEGYWMDIGQPKDYLTVPISMGETSLFILQQCCHWS